jgi:hypothetical protein
LLAEILEGVIQLAVDLPLDVAGDAEPAGLGQALEAGGQVDPVAEDVLAVDDDVAQVDAHAPEDLAVRRRRVIALGEGALDLGGAGHRVDHAGELGQEAVAHELDDAPPAPGDGRFDQLLVVGLDGGQGADLVGAHEAAVAGHVGGQDGGKPAFDVLGHGARASSWEIRNTRLAEVRRIGRLSGRPSARWE